ATVPVKNSQVFYDSCVSKGVAARLILFANGPHGCCWANGESGSPNLPLVAVWPDSSIAFFTRQGLFTTGVFHSRLSIKPLADGGGFHGFVPVFAHLGARE